LGEQRFIASITSELSTGIISSLDRDQPFDPELAKPNRPFVSERQAHKVASILATNNPGKRFVVYEAAAVVVSVPMMVVSSWA
jgi:hypothetical protein